MENSVNQQHQVLVWLQLVKIELFERMVRAMDDPTTIALTFNESLDRANAKARPVKSRAGASRGWSEERAEIVRTSIAETLTADNHKYGSLAIVKFRFEQTRNRVYAVDDDCGAPSLNNAVSFQCV